MNSSAGKVCDIEIFRQIQYRVTCYGVTLICFDALTNRGLNDGSVSGLLWLSLYNLLNSINF